MNSTLTVTIPRQLWLTSNRPIRGHAHRNRLVQTLHERTALAARSQQLEPHECAVHAVWTVQYPKGTTWKHGDPANAHPTTKAMLDGLVDGGWLPGDGPLVVVAETFRRGPNLDVPELHDITLELMPAVSS